MSALLRAFDRCHGVLCARDHDRRIRRSRPFGAVRAARRKTRGAVLLWTLLISAGMVVLAGMTYQAMYLYLIAWRTEREQIVVRYAALALLARCEASRFPTSRVDASTQACDLPASWKPMHEAMRVTPPPVRWRADMALAEQAAGVDHLIWRGPQSSTDKRAGQAYSAPLIVDAFCLSEAWLRADTVGRVDVLTVRAQRRRIVPDKDVRSHAEEGIWLQSIVVRRAVPCLQTVRRAREIVDPWRRRE